MFEDLKDALKGTVEKKEASGQWINGKFVPNQPEQQYYQQPVQPVPQQYQQPQQPQPVQQAQPIQQPQPVQQQPVQQYQPQQPQSIYQQPQYYQQPQPQQQGGMRCPKCKGYNVNVQVIEVGSTSKTKKTGVGLGGHAHNAARAGAAFVTLGASNLVIKKATGEAKTKTKTKTQTMCVCQNCGKTWKV